MTGWVLLLAILSRHPATAQIPMPTRPNPQSVANRGDSAAAQELLEVPDSIVFYRYDPRFPVDQMPSNDSLLNLDYVRYDPVLKAGPDFVYLNTVVQPAILQPVLGTPYERILQLQQPEHPAYRPGPPPVFHQNVAYSYVAYNQSGEIDDGQVQALFGRPFANGWHLGLQLFRTYQAAQRNRYPQSGGDRLDMSAALSYLPDSSRHRAFLWGGYNSRGHFNPGGFAFAIFDTLSPPETAFTAANRLNNLRTEGRTSTLHYLHRVFLNKQLDSTARGAALSLELGYDHQRLRHASPFLDSASYGPYGVDDRGVRVAAESASVLAEAALEFFSPNEQSRLGQYNLKVGAYAGRQSFVADYQIQSRSLDLVGLAGELDGELLRQFKLRASADLPLLSRVGEGSIRGDLSWSYKERFALRAFTLLERSSAPWMAQSIGANDALLFQRDLPVSTHSSIGAGIAYLPWKARIDASLEVFGDAIVYDSIGIAQAASGAISIPTLRFDLPLGWGPIRLDSRGVLRIRPTSGAVRLPVYTGQHSLYLQTRLFKRSMELIGGFDGLIRTSQQQYGYFPLTGTFTLDPDAPTSDLQWSLDAFLAIKVMTFNAFVRFENLFVKDPRHLPATVFGYPVVRDGAGLASFGLFRLGLAFSLYN